MNYSKKLFLLPEQEFRRIKEKSDDVYSQASTQLDSEISEILRRQDLSNEDKLILYQQLLSRYLTYKQKQGEQTVKIEVTEEPRPLTDIIKSLPKRYRTTAIEQLSKLKWDKHGQILHNDSPVIASDISNLIHGYVSSAKQTRAHARTNPGWKELTEVLGEPTDLLPATPRTPASIDKTSAAASPLIAFINRNRQKQTQWVDGEEA